jgi:type III pantothenate kinase
MPARIIASMLVAIDAGNTEVKAAIVRDGRVLSVRRAPTRARVAAYDAEGLVADALGTTGGVGALAAGATAIDAIALVSVVPPWTEAVAELASRLRRPLLEATPSTIPIAVRGPVRERVGADRLLNAFAALRLHGAPVIVVDLGTATTVDAVATDGAFVGGSIAAGIGLGMAALASGTALLPRSALDTVPRHAIGRDTREAMQAGAILGHVGVVAELTRSIRHELAPDGARVTTVVTGGFAAAPWVSLLRDVDVVDPHLTLKGLAVLHAAAGAAVAP